MSTTSTDPVFAVVTDGSLVGNTFAASPPYDSTLTVTSVAVTASSQSDGSAASSNNQVFGLSAAAFSASTYEPGNGATGSRRSGRHNTGTLTRSAISTTRSVSNGNAKNRSSHGKCADTAWSGTI